MTGISCVYEAFERGRSLYEKTGCEKAAACFSERMIMHSKGEKHGLNTLALGDNLRYMKFLADKKDMAGGIQLIYGDPPFFSEGRYEASVKLDSEILGASGLIKAGAYEDIWKGDMAKYLEMLTVRLFMMRELLSESGCLLLHLDWHVAHYVKVIMDQIFGEENFVNEIIWTYKSGGTGRRSFSKKHDTILFYSKSKNYKFNPLREKSYNREFRPYRFRGVEEFEDDRGWYTMVNMKDVWSLDMVGRTSAERTGYATQKPEKLLERIVAACSDEGDLCADFFAGSGTLGSVCERMGRRWIMCDAGRLAVSDQIKRLGGSGAGFSLESEDEGHEEGNLIASEENGAIILHGYEARTADISLKGRDEFERFAAEDSLSLIKYWSVDTDFDGRIHKSSAFMTAGERSFATGGSFPEDTGRRLHVMGQDVLGNFFSWMPERKE